MLEYIMPFLIFLSLGVIVYIVGKHLSEFKKIHQDYLKSENNIRDEKAIERFKRIFYKGGVLLKNGFFCFIEIIIKKIKQFLHLLHFWVLKNKKGNNGGDELSVENEVKQELINSEEESLERIIEDDLAEEVSVDISKDFSFHKNKKVEKEINIEEEEEVIVIEDDFLSEPEEELGETEGKIKSFFSEEAKKIDAINDREKKFSLAVIFGAIGGFMAKFKKEKLKEEDLNEKEVDHDNLFSDGIVDVREVDAGMSSVNNHNLIKEVVPVRKKEPIDIDDEIGVDRSILEKKLIQKIANNPKDMENYRELGELYIKMKSFSDAEECYKQILKVHLRDVDAKRKMEKIKLLKRMG